MQSINCSCRVPIAVSLFVCLSGYNDNLRNNKSINLKLEHIIVHRNTSSLQI